MGDVHDEATGCGRRDRADDDGPRAYAAPVNYVVDGDTIRLRSGVYVRLIGIDTPETGECGYRPRNAS
jgi:endonuclease YncB( thermonuclease family)